MLYLSFADVDIKWRRINRRWTSTSFISALWGYCKSWEVSNWNRLFFDAKEIEKVIELFYDEGGLIHDNEDMDVRSSLLYMKEVMVPYFLATETQECGFVAHLILKYFEVLHPDEPWKKNIEILGARGMQARDNFQSSSSWCRMLSVQEFDEDIELAIKVDDDASTEEEGEIPEPQQSSRLSKRLRVNENGKWVNIG